MLGIVIPVMNLWKEYTQRCLETLKISLDEYGGDYYVVIIDNNSNDETPKGIEKVRNGFKQMEYVRNTINRGVAGSWNDGIKKCIEKNCNLMLVSNNDVLFHRNTVKALLKAMNRANAGLVTPVNVRSEIMIPEEVLNLTDKPINDSPHPDFSCFLITKEAYLKTGEFDEGFQKAFFEDNDYVWRLYASGYKPIATTEAMYYHYGSRTQNQVAGGIVTGAEFEKNRNYFMAKWGANPVNHYEEMEAVYYKNPFNDKSKPLTYTYQDAR